MNLLIEMIPNLQLRQEIANLHTKIEYTNYDRPSDQYKAHHHDVDCTSEFSREFLDSMLQQVKKKIIESFKFWPDQARAG